jgi:RNA polymerase sigma factor (TIGR02999 family)
MPQFEVYSAPSGPTTSPLGRLANLASTSVRDTRTLVHESFLRFLKSGDLRAADRRAFFAYASTVMRSVIVNTARDRGRQKRGSGRRPLTLSTQIADKIAEGDDDVLRVHEALDALDALERADPRLAHLVQMRYFGGYSEQEVADTLEVTVRTVQRLWFKARIMLQAAME